MRFSKVNAVRIPKGDVKKIRHNGKKLWSAIMARYVSLGDSIAAGHLINDEWETDYGTDSQYGNNGNTETVIVSGCYTDLIRDELAARVGGTVNATSFAKSGDRVDDLIAKLDHAVVRNAIAKADYVTLCIGANDVLEPALSHIDQYINTGDLNSLATIVEGNLARLADDSNANSYTALFNKLKGINPNAKYVFTTIYNPYKYLWITKGTWNNDYKDSFFAPIFRYVPEMSTLGIEWDKELKKALLNTSIVSKLFDRVNGLDDWAETYVTALNNVLRTKLVALNNPNFTLADTKAVFDCVPDRPVSAQKHYNDLVNVEYTRGYDTAQMDWGALWRGNIIKDSNGNPISNTICNDPETFWDILLDRYMDGLFNIDYDGLASTLVAEIVEQVIVPNIDPHPEEYGQYVMKRVFEDALGWSSLDRYTVTYNANGASGTMATQQVLSVDGLPAFTTIRNHSFAPAAGYYFTSWNTAVNGGGTGYYSGQLVGITGNLTLNAQWSNVYTINVHHSEDSNYHDSGDTGPMECYALWIDGVEQADLGQFFNGARVYNLPYGSQVGVIVQTKTGSGRSYITLNGNKIAGNSSDARYTFTVTNHMDIHFQWNYWLDDLRAQSYWNCYVTTY